MIWSDLNIWENFKNFFESITKNKNYFLVLFVTFLYCILIFAIYPFLTKDINETFRKYTFILGGTTLTLMVLFIYFCSQLKGALEINKGFYPTLVSIETLLIFFLIIYIVYSNRSWFDSFTTYGQGLWNVVNIILVFAFIVMFMWRFIECYVSSINDVKCNNGAIFDTWWISTTILSGLFILLVILNKSYRLNKDILIKQTTVYVILIFFVLMIILNGGNATSNFFDQSQGVTPNSILQSMVKVVCIIIIIICMQVFYTFSSDDIKPFTIAAIVLIVINILPFVFNIPKSWIQTIIFYPIFFLFCFVTIFLFVGGFNFFYTAYNLWYLISIIRGEKALSIPNITFNGAIFHGILFVFVFGFVVFLLFTAVRSSKKAVGLAKEDTNTASKNAENAAKSEGESEEDIKKAGEDAKNKVKDSASASGYHNFIKSLNEWWLWAGFSGVYALLFGISMIIYANNEKINERLNAISMFSVIIFTICYITILYSEFFNFNRTSWFNQKKTDADLSIYAKNVSVILIVGVLLYSLSKYAKINNSFIIIFILLSVIFIYNKLQGSLYTKLWQHASHTNCDISKKSGISFAFIFLVISLGIAFYLSDTTLPGNPIYILVAVLISIFGYYFGEYVISPSKANKNETYCNAFKSTPPLTSLDSIKTIIFISIIILLFVAMNFFTQKLKNAKNSLYQLFIIGVAIFLFWSYVVILGQSLPNVTDISTLIFNKEYYTPNLKNRWCDFLIIVTTFIIFMSGIGLIITICSNQIFAGFFNTLSMIITGKTIAEIFNQVSKTPFTAVLEVPNRPVRWNTVKKTFGLFLLLFYKIFESFIMIPLKLNSIYDSIGKYVEQNFLTGAFIILVIEFIIVGIYVLCRTIYRSIKSTFLNESTNRFALIKTPTYIFPSTETKYEELPEEQPYTFGLSFSLFIEEAGDANYFIPILSYNNNPCIMYKPSANNLVVTIPKGNASINTPVKWDDKNADMLINSYTILNSHIGSTVDDKYIVYSTTGVKLQTWINIFINYKDGIIDTFLDGNLVNSNNINQIQIDQYTNSITLGFKGEDTHIKINNLDYYNKDIGVDNILRINTKNHFTE